MLDAFAERCLVILKLRARQLQFIVSPMRSTGNSLKNNQFGFVRKALYAIFSLNFSAFVQRNLYHPSNDAVNAKRLHQSCTHFFFQCSRFSAFLHFNLMWFHFSYHFWILKCIGAMQLGNWRLAPSASKTKALRLRFFSEHWRKENLVSRLNSIWNVEIARTPIRAAN